MFHVYFLFFRSVYNLLKLFFENLRLLGKDDFFVLSSTNPEFYEQAKMMGKSSATSAARKLHPPPCRARGGPSRAPLDLEIFAEDEK